MSLLADLRKAGSPHDISVRYGITEGTLASYRSRGGGPRFYRVGRKIFYFFDDVENWLTQERWPGSPTGKPELKEC